MKVVDDDGNDVEGTGEEAVGEIAIKGHNIMKGYWGKEDATKEVLDEDGWFRTGDMAYVDDDGYFFIVDRKKDMIIRGGYNVYPREIEEVLYEHPAVSEAAVIGIPDDSKGEEVGAAVVLADGEEVDADELREYVKERVANYKYPRKIWFPDELPEGPDRQDPQARDRGPRAGRGLAVAATTEAPRKEQPAAPKGAASSGLDTMLTDATRGPLRRMLPGRAAVKLAAKLATRPDTVVTRGAQLAAELAKVGLGRSELEPAKGDRRFKDDAWRGNPAFKRLLQSYLATGQAVDGLIGDAGLDWRSERQVRFAVENVLDALAPSNAPLTNPAVLKAALDTGGRNFARGAANFARDMSKPPRIPSMVDTSAFTVGEDIAVTPGQIVLRSPVFELIQYKPQTSKVRERPLLLTPPMINKYYIADLAPGRSMMEYAVKQGQQVFAISWRNPTESHADWDLDTYAGAVLEALDAVEAITGSDSTHVMGLCAGGIVLSTVVAHLAAKGEQDRIAGLTLGVTVLDQHNAGTTGAFMGANTAMAATAESARKGYLSGRSLAGVFAWLRPNDLIWNYWVSNYLMGKTPPAFDILFWNADATNLPAALHRDFLRARARQLAHQAGHRDRARHADRPVEDHGRLLRRRGHRRPHHAVAERLPDGEPARLRPRASCSPRAGTSPRWSTRRATRRRASGSTTSCPRSPRRG